MQSEAKELQRAFSSRSCTLTRRGPIRVHGPYRHKCCFLWLRLCLGHSNCVESWGNFADRLPSAAAPVRLWLGIKFPLLGQWCRLDRRRKSASAENCTSQCQRFVCSCTSQCLRTRGQGKQPLTTLSVHKFLDRMDTEGFEVWKAEKRPTFTPQSHGQGRFIIMCSFVYSSGAVSIHFSRSKLNPLSCSFC